MGRLVCIVLLSSWLFLICSVKAQTGLIDVTKLGAKPGSDISQALTNAWKQACSSTAPAKIVIPKGTFLLKEAKLVGPCKSPIELQVQGTLQAPVDPSQMTKGVEWITVNYLDKFTLSGGGILDGQGTKAWTQNNCAKVTDCSKLPNNLSFNFLTNSIIHDITSLNSKLFHVNVFGCNNVTFSKFTITAPENSPNTDGIHLGRSTKIRIIDSHIQTGDDCVSIGDGVEQVNITKVNCGPGHGISIGSLGKNAGEKPVVGIFVRDCTISNTLNGVRLKSWPASKEGSVSDIHFEGIIMQNVSNPVLIDQEYCPHNQCTLSSPSRVKISKVSFKNITGTSATPVMVNLVCSKSLPCEGVEIGDIDLKYHGATPRNIVATNCVNVKPTLSGKQNPPVCTKPAQAS